MGAHRATAYLTLEVHDEQALDFVTAEKVLHRLTQ